MEVIATPIAGLFEVQLAPRVDDRGYFMRSYDEAIFAAHGLSTHWVQENQSLSLQRGTLRGLHYQRPPHAETKLVRALAGCLLDVAVDLRCGSATYGQHHAVILSAENHRALYIPRGFAHGFCTMVEHTIVAYKVDHPYTPAAEGGLLWRDSQLAIDWPLDNQPSPGQPAQITDKDQSWPTLSEQRPLEVAMQGALL